MGWEKLPCHNEQRKPLSETLIDSLTPCVCEENRGTELKLGTSACETISFLHCQ